MIILMLQYIARKGNIGCDLTERESWRVDQGHDQIIDIRRGFIGLIYGDRYETL